MIEKKQRRNSENDILDSDTSQTPRFELRTTTSTGSMQEQSTRSKKG